VSRTLFVGIGNRYRRDDGAGLVAADRVRRAAPQRMDVAELDGEPLALLDRWDEADRVIVVDAVLSGAEAGTIFRFNAMTDPPPPAFRGRGSHTFSLAEVIELATALNRLPHELVAYGVEGSDFAAGTGLSPAVDAAAAEVARRILADTDGAEA
jgi:hydrogenase maturation protease